LKLFFKPQTLINTVFAAYFLGNMWGKVRNDKGLKSQQIIPLPATAEKLNNDAHLGMENPDLTPSYLNGGKGLPIMNNIIDRNFYTMMQSIKNCGGVETLASAIVQNFHKLPDDKKKWYVTRFGKNGTFELLPLVQPRAKSLYNHADDIIWFYERLANYRSRYALFAFVHNWAFWGDLLGRVGKIRDDIYKEYLDFDVLSFGVNEVYADCGGFIGDSLADYLNEVGADSYKKIYVYEFDPHNCEAIEKMLNTTGLRNIVLRKKAVGLHGKLRYTPVAPEADHSGNSLSDIGEVEVDVVSLDDDINEPLTYIKMDIEGSEYAAILGAKRHIADEYPKLAVCLYHKPNDIWELPRLIDAIAPKYRFYITFCGFAMDTVGFAMLAVKDETKSAPANQIKCAAIIGVNERGEFMKRSIKNDGGYSLVKYCAQNDLRQVVDMYKSGEIDLIILADTNFGYRPIIAALNDLGVPECYVVNQFYYQSGVKKSSLEDELIRVDTSKTNLTSFQTHLVDHCNQNCKGCAHFCNLVKEPHFADLEQYKKDIKRLSEIYYDVSLLILLGGEPLLNPQIEEFIKASREAFPIGTLEVYSNGLLVTRQPESLFETMRKYRCQFRFTAYKPTYAKREEIGSFLRERSIIYGFTGYEIPIEHFSASTFLNPEPQNENEVWNKCKDTICHVLQDGHLYPCGHNPWFHYLEDHFGIKVNHGDTDKLRIPLHTTTLNGNQINALLDGPHEACKYCGILNMRPFQWQTCPRDKAKLEDYVIDAD
jgi:FkbM family methyltransferase